MPNFDTLQNCKVQNVLEYAIERSVKINVVIFEAPLYNYLQYLGS